MRERRVVVDASVLVQALQGTPGSRDALHGRRLAAPALIYPEAAHALRRFELRGFMTAQQSTSLFRTLLATALDVVDWRPTAERVWELRHTVAPYDASYVALAELLDVPLVTADRRLANAPGVRCEVVVL